MAIPTTFLATLHGWRAEQRDLSNKPTESALDFIHAIDRVVFAQSSMVRLSHPALCDVVRDARLAQMAWERRSTHNAMVTLKAAQDQLDAAIRATDREVARQRQLDTDQQTFFAEAS